MKKVLLTITMFSLIFWFTGCDEDSLTPQESVDLVTLNKAGTGIDVPNTFDVDGYLCGTEPMEPMELWMGVGNETAGTLVGHATFILDNPSTNEGRVRIDLFDYDEDGTPDMFPYVATDLHIHFADDIDDTVEEGGIPRTKKGNPIVGLFEYNIPLDSYETVIEVPVEFQAVGAIHLTVKKFGGIEGFEFYLPNDPVKMFIKYDANIYPSMNLHIEGGGFISEYDSGLGAGVYEAYCFARHLDIDWNIEYEANLYSSYEEIPDYVLAQANIIEANLPNANYLLNTYSIGDMIDGLGNLNAYDIQGAIWKILHGEMDLPDYYFGFNKINLDRVKVIYNEAILEINDTFIPGCDQKIVFLSVPIDPESLDPNIDYAQIIIGQPIIGEIEVPCETLGGTAWGDGKEGANFPGAKQWGTWFNYGCE